VTHNLTENDTKPCTIQQDNLLISIMRQPPQKNSCQCATLQNPLKVWTANKQQKKFSYLVENFG